MTKNEQENLEALKIGFEMTEWEDFLLVLNEIRNRDKELIALYRKSHIELKELKKSLPKDSLLLEVEKHFGIGCRKICQERHEQINKHGRTVELDVKYNTEGQLLHASRVLTMGDPILPEIKKKPPINWDTKIWVKMCEKEYFEDRIVVSASLTAAEIDRMNAEINEIFNHKSEPTE